MFISNYNQGGGIRKVALIQTGDQNRPSAWLIGRRNEEIKTGNEDQLHFSSIRRVALIPADSLSCGLRPLVDRTQKMKKIKVAFGLANRMEEKSV
jgi:hypothetical protein